MKILINQMEGILDTFLPLLKAIPEKEFEDKPSPSKWSKKEIVGHLIDSAQNNLRRFIVAQYETKPRVVYDQDQWVKLAGYQQWNSSDIVQLWYLLNKQICQVWKTMSPEMYDRDCETQVVHSIQWLAEDYVKHLLHHLHAILDLEPVAYP